MRFIWPRSSVTAYTFTASTTKENKLYALPNGIAENLILMSDPNIMQILFVINWFLMTVICLVIAFVVNEHYRFLYIVGSAVKILCSARRDHRFCLVQFHFCFPSCINQKSNCIMPNHYWNGKTKNMLIAAALAYERNKLGNYANLNAN